MTNLHAINRTGIGQLPEPVSAAQEGFAYLSDEREIAFFLWELHRLDQTLLGQPPFESLRRDDVEALLEKAGRFAAKLAAAYRESDRKPAHLGADGEVVVPRAYHALWAEFRRDWSWIRRMGERPSARLAGNGPHMPPLVVQIVSEMFMGANPSFMTYGGFTSFAMNLIERHGTEDQKDLFLPKLATDEWDACYCATETQAGSDLTAIATSAAPLGGDVYAIRGHKKYITAGMHPLTENTLCIVIARIEDPVRHAFSLSCFLVPRYRIDADGTLHNNHVECRHVEDKMGFNGCANTHLVFGESGQTRGYLLGNRQNVALPQLVTLMRNARIATGQFGVGMASSIYRHSLRHAASRVQGRRITETTDASAAAVPIIEHHDVQRMLLELKCKVEGCRGLIGRLVGHLTRVEQLTASDTPDMAEIDRQRKLILLYTPIIKAYVSDEAWKAATISIQVHGGAGYMRDNVIELYARDIKVLSIWEGTNYMQAQDLLRDKLSYGRQSQLMRHFVNEMKAFLATGSRTPELAREFRQLSVAMSALQITLDHIRMLAEGGDFFVISQFATRFLEMFAEVILGWVHLETAVRAVAEIAAGQTGSDKAFYEGKVKAARYFIHNTLPGVMGKADILRCSQDTFAYLSPEQFGLPQAVDSAPAAPEPAFH